MYKFTKIFKVGLPVFLVFTVIFLLFGGVFSVKAAPNGEYPRLANYYLSWTLNESQARQLSKWDLVVLDMEVGYKNAALVRKMRQWNPDIIILAYITPQEIRQDATVSYSVMRSRLASGIKDDWYLKNSSGKKLSWWQGTFLLNVTLDAPTHSGERFVDYLAGFVSDEIISTGLWDGVFYDNMWDNITYFAGNDVDIDLDGTKDYLADAKWREGMKYLYDKTKSLTGNSYYILGNGTSPEYIDSLDGKLIENFGSEGWSRDMNTYDNHDENVELNIVNFNTGNSGNSGDYQELRYGLNSALMEDAYFSYDYGDTNHSQLWWYDEYNINLGNPKEEAQSLDGYSDYAPGVWTRGFSNGLSIVNSSNRARLVDLGGEYEKIHGTQDRVTNDGSIVSEVSVDSEDGLVLLKTFNSLQDIIFTNGEFARFFRPDGTRVRNGFFVFDDTYRGGDKVGSVDLDGNGKRDLLVVSGNKITVWRDDGQPFFKKYPYGANYSGGLKVAIGDLNRDLKMEIYVSAEEGFSAPIKVYTRHGRQMKRDWYPFGEGYTGGYSIGVANLGGLKRNNLAIGSGSGLEPTVNIYDHHYEHLRAWYPFERSFRGGISMDVGDVNADGLDEIVVGAGEGKDPLIKVFDSFGEQLYDEFKAYDSLGKSGIKVLTLDVDYDGVDDIVGFSEGL